MDEPKLIPGGKAFDDRGSVSFVNDLDFSTIKRFYQVENHTAGYIRAWHAHKKEGKFVYVVSGAVLVGTVHLDTNEVKKFILTAEQPKILWIPPNYANGFKNLQNNTRIIFFSTSTLAESAGDDIRFPYDQWNIWQEDYR